MNKYTQQVKREYKFKNVIVDQGLDYLVSGQGAIREIASYCQVGTGSTAPSESDTGLVSALSPRVLGSTSTTVAQGWSGTDYYHFTQTVLFDAAQVNGNLTEFAWWRLLNDGAGQVIWNRALFRDEEGNAITVTKTSEEQLRIFYTIHIIPPADDVVDTIELDGNMYEYTIRSWFVGQNAGGWRNQGVANPVSFARYFSGDTTVPSAYGNVSQPARTGDANGLGTASSGTSSVAGYTNGNFYRDSLLTWNPGVGNFSPGIGLIGLSINQQVVASYGAFTIGWDPVIPKTSIQRLQINTRWSFTRP